MGTETFLARAELFLTIIAGVIFILCCLNIYALSRYDNDRIDIIVAEAMGQNPIGEAFWKTVFVALICLSWIVTRFF